MTDIERRIDAHLQNDNAEQRWLDSDNLLEEAQAEIERLRSALHVIHYLNSPQARGLPRQITIQDIAAAALEGKTNESR